MHLGTRSERQERDEARTQGEGEAGTTKNTHKKRKDRFEKSGRIPTSPQSCEQDEVQETKRKRLGGGEGARPRARQGDTVRWEEGDEERKEDAFRSPRMAKLKGDEGNAGGSRQGGGVNAAASANRLEASRVNELIKRRRETERIQVSE